MVASHNAQSCQHQSEQQPAAAAANISQQQPAAGNTSHTYVNSFDMGFILTPPSHLDTTGGVTLRVCDSFACWAAARDGCTQSSSDVCQRGTWGTGTAQAYIAATTVSVGAAWASHAPHEHHHLRRITHLRARATGDTQRQRHATQPSSTIARTWLSLRAFRWSRTAWRSFLWLSRVANTSINEHPRACM